MDGRDRILTKGDMARFSDYKDGHEHDGPQFRSCEHVTTDLRTWHTSLWAETEP